MKEIRTYETFKIVWTNMDGSHSEWTGFDSAEEAQKSVDFVASNSGRLGEVVRKTWQVEIDPKFAHLYLPGVQA